MRSTERGNVRRCQLLNLFCNNLIKLRTVGERFKRLELSFPARSESRASHRSNRPNVITPVSVRTPEAQQVNAYVRVEKGSRKESIEDQCTEVPR